MSEDVRRSRLLTMVLLTVIGVVVVVAAVIAVLVRPGATSFDAGTPEGVVQRYAQAVSEGDTSTALEYLVPEVADSCDHAALDANDLRVTLIETIDRGDAARVRVMVTTIYGSGPFGPSEFQSEEVFSLVSEGDGWRIQTTPWQFTVCYNEVTR